MEGKTEPVNPEENERLIRESSRNLWTGLRGWFRQVTDLEAGMDREGKFITGIIEGKRVSGTNAWMLMCSVVIASIGLDLNSAAVIIGAMLISPLMSPILGIGLGVAINDRIILRQALRHFGIMIIIALVASTLYFLISPFGTMNEQIRGRTEPTLLDALVAVFGGLAGIISITREDKSNAIPGVAIATALMPPLCVTGFGIASGEPKIILNSFYLFFLNSFFIALTAYAIIRLLGFTGWRRESEDDIRRTRLYIAAFSILVMVPSAFIFRSVIKDVHYNQQAKVFVNDKFGKDCIEYKIIRISPDSALLVAELLDRAMPDSAQLASYNRVLRDSYNLRNTYLRPIPDYGVELEELDRMQYEISKLGNVAVQVEALESNQRVVRQENTVLMSELQFWHPDSLTFSRLSNSIHAAIPRLEAFTYSMARGTDFRQSRDSLLVVLVDWPDDMRRREIEEEETRLRNLLPTLLENKVDSVIMVRHNFR